MITTPEPIDVPLRKDAHGKLRVGDTQILLELLIHAFRNGETPEEMADSYPTLRLADLYAVLAYYLDHRTEVDAYVREADETAARIQREVEAAYAPDARAFRARLRARRDEKHKPAP